jgi:hypothetical protein
MLEGERPWRYKSALLKDWGIANGSVRVIAIFYDLDNLELPKFAS